MEAKMAFVLGRIPGGFDELLARDSKLCLQERREGRAYYGYDIGYKGVRYSISAFPHVDHGFTNLGVAVAGPTEEGVRKILGAYLRLRRIEIEERTSPIRVVDLQENEVSTEAST